MNAAATLAGLSLGQLSVMIFTQNQERGWWDKPRNLSTLCALVVTEYAEGIEGDRKNLPDDHLPQYPMRTVELADAIIRLADLFGGLHRFGYTPFITRAATTLWPEHEGDIVWHPLPLAGIEKQADMRLPFKEGQPYSSRVLPLLSEVSRAGILFQDRELSTMMETADCRLATTALIGAFFGTLLLMHKLTGSREKTFEVIADKLAYNTRRADHSREARNAVGGKKY